MTNGEIAVRCTDRLWRLNNLYTITDKKRPPRHLHDELGAGSACIGRLHRQNVILKARPAAASPPSSSFLMLDACHLQRRLPCRHHRAIPCPMPRLIFRDKIRFPYDHLPEMIKAMVPARNDNSCELLLATTPRSAFGVVAALRHAAIPARVGVRQDLRAVPREGARGALRPRSTPVDKNGFLCSSRAPREGQDGHFFELCQAARTRRNAGDALTAMDFKFHFSPWQEDEDLYAGRLDRSSWPASYRDYFARWSGWASHSRRSRRPGTVKKAEQQQGDMKREYPSTADEAFEARDRGRLLLRPAGADGNGRAG